MNRAALHLIPMLTMPAASTWEQTLDGPPTPVRTTSVGHRATSTSGPSTKGREFWAMLHASESSRPPAMRSRFLR